MLKHGPLTRYKKIAGCAYAGNAGNVFPRRRFKRKPLVSDTGMHHGTCVTHVPWCMSGSLTCGDGENVPGIPGACAPAILRIWQEAHYTHVVCRLQAMSMRTFNVEVFVSVLQKILILKSSRWEISNQLIYSFYEMPDIRFPFTPFAFTIIR